ncbi:unnamed protein product [Paramecium sonneborni]|uniref:Uncharacterized protein n=1 Tax=Paramecium sonneborni TaxID=65129 RepID=A0A8S1RS96_9CILI|nr:unnamed protein product [Paramecium sonneborni]CAD8129979.1 unnamed protein product [Paramecium sonneborni]
MEMENINKQAMEYHQDGIYINIGKWIELNEGFRNQQLIIHKGEYSINGRKLGRLNIMYCLFLNIAHKQIRGGLYDQGGSQIKIGKWMKFDKRFKDKNQVTQYGVYNKA